MKLAQILLSKIRPNPDNPRGIDIESQDTKLSFLRDSIAHFGIMVPLVVVEDGDGYLLIDGERRYWASRSLSLEKVPAFILGKKGDLNSKDILFRMFQIHHNREQWGPVQQCAALEGLYKSLSGMRSIASLDTKLQMKEIAEGIVDETGMEYATAMTRVFFLRWPIEIKQKLYNNPNEEGYWYICEIEGKIIIPALGNYPEYFEKVPVDQVRIDLFKKLESNAVERSVDVRKVAPYFRERMSADADRKKIAVALKRLHGHESTTYGEVQEELQREFPHLSKPVPASPRKLFGLLHGMQVALDDFDYSALNKKTKGGISRPKLDLAARAVNESLEKFIRVLKEGTK
jgi:ParB/RepB/Spo0J family partition protein